MEVRPIFSAMLRNKTGSILIALQIAVTLAVVVNALFIISARLEKMNLPVGTDVENTFFSQSIYLSDNVNTEAAMNRDLRAIREMPGVKSAISVLSYLHSGSARVDTYRAMPEVNDDMEILANINYTDEHGLDALNATLLAGEFFTAADIQHIDINFNGVPDKVVVTESLAKKFFPDLPIEQITGKHIYYDTRAIPVKIQGIISDIAAAWIAQDNPQLVDNKYNFMLHPYSIYASRAAYMVRTEPGLRAEIIASSEQVLLEQDSNRLIQAVRTLDEVIAFSYRNDRATMVVLIVVMVLMVSITGFGIVGLAAFNVRQRTRQIGTRRALGARKKDIVRYFIVENLILSSIGLALGAVLTYMLNYVISTQFGGERLEPVYVPAGMFILYCLGLISVFGPAIRAASIPPALATRTV